MKWSPRWLKQDMGRANKMHGWQVEELPPEDETEGSRILECFGPFDTKQEAINMAKERHNALGGRWYVRIVKAY